MTDAERAALREIRGYASAWRIRYSQHALDRMDERGATRQDVQAALAGATELQDTAWRAVEGHRGGPRRR